MAYVSIYFSHNNKQEQLFWDSYIFQSLKGCRMMNNGCSQLLLPPSNWGRNWNYSCVVMYSTHVLPKIYKQVLTIGDVSTEKLLLLKINNLFITERCAVSLYFTIRQKWVIYFKLECLLVFVSLQRIQPILFVIYSHGHTVWAIVKFINLWIPLERYICI